MNLKQAQAVLSDFLLKCEDEGIALPDDPLSAVLAAVRALSHEAKHEVGRPQMEAAFAKMRQQFGMMAGAAKTGAAASPPAKNIKNRKSKDNKTATKVEPERAIKVKATSPTDQGKATGKSKMKEDVESKPAVRPENQALVDQLVQLAEYELLSGHTQRGVARLRGAKEVRDAQDVITSGAQARALDGVGPSVAAKIDVILSQGLDSALAEYN